MWVTFALITVVILLYALDAAPLEVVGMSSLVFFLLFFEIFPFTGIDGSRVSYDKLLEGFANPALITVLALLIIGQGLFQTNALDKLTQRIQLLAVRKPSIAFVTILLIAAIASAFVNNTPMVVIFLPILGAVVRKINMSVSKAYMPLSFATILGGMITLIGSSTNLLVAGVAERMGVGTIGFFDFAIPGLMVAVVGLTYVIFIMPRLLPVRESLTQNASGSGGKQFIAQIQVTRDHPLEGHASVAGLFPQLKNITVRMVQRGEHAFVPPFEDVRLQAGDIIIVAATRSALTEAIASPQGFLTVDSNDMGEAENGEGAVRDILLAETIVAPGSRLIGRSIEQSGLRAQTGCIVLGIQRRNRMIRTQLSDIRLEAGDVLLVAGARRDVKNLRASKDVLLLDWSTTEVALTPRAGRAIAIFLGVVISAAFGIVPIVVSALTGAFLMVISGCLNIRQAARAFDRNIYILVGTSIAMAFALEQTGGAIYIAHLVASASSVISPIGSLSLMFIVIAILTNVLSNNATAVLFTPIAIGITAKLGIDPIVAVVTVIFAANCSFATPIGYQTNLLVLGPGHYKFGDFARAGVPLVIIVWLAFTAIAYFYYGVRL
jgi:di/tricarboxylate transporter